MKIYSKFMICLMFVYTSCIFSMSQTDEHIPPVTLRNILNTTPYTIDLEMNHRIIATIGPKRSEQVYTELPLNKENREFKTPVIYVNVNNIHLFKWEFKRLSLIDTQNRTLYSAEIVWKTPSWLRTEDAEAHFTTGQNDSYEIDIVFSGKGLDATEFEILQTIK